MALRRIPISSRGVQRRDQATEASPAYGTWQLSRPAPAPAAPGACAVVCRGAGPTLATHQPSQWAELPDNCEASHVHLYGHARNQPRVDVRRRPGQPGHCRSCGVTLLTPLAYGRASPAVHLRRSAPARPSCRPRMCTAHGPGTKEWSRSGSDGAGAGPDGLVLHPRHMSAVTVSRGSPFGAPCALVSSPGVGVPRIPCRGSSGNRGPPTWLPAGRTATRPGPR
jgi:hypothetical protein